MRRWRRQHAGRARARRGAAVVALVVSTSLVSACSVAPFRTFEGARRFNSGSEALEQGDTGRAILELEEAAELVPHEAEIHNRLGLAYWAEGRVDSARGAFEEALALDCDHVAAQRNLERLLASEGRAAIPRNEGNDHGG